MAYIYIYIYISIFMEFFYTFRSIKYLIPFLFCAISIILCTTLCNARRIHVFTKRRQTDSPVSKIKTKSTSMMTLQPSYQEAYW
jgi:hypothetical protein